MRIQPLSPSRGPRRKQILVMQHGQIIERGTHDQLLAASGRYSRLARIQGTTYIEESFEKLEAAATPAALV